MNTQTKTVKRTIVSLKLPVSVPALLQTTKVILLAVTHNPSFPAPDPSLATLQAALLALEEAETAVRSGSRGAAASRDEKRRELGTLLRQVGAYVQKVADGDPSTAGTLDVPSSLLGMVQTGSNGIEILNVNVATASAPNVAVEVGAFSEVYAFVNLQP